MSAIGSVITSPESTDSWRGASKSHPSLVTCRRFNYQLDFVTPGMCPSSARSRKQMRQSANLRRYPRPRPHRRQRLCTREVKTLRCIPAAFARLTDFLSADPCCSFTRRLALSSARLSSLALYIEDVLAIVPLSG